MVKKYFKTWAILTIAAILIEVITNGEVKPIKLVEGLYFSQPPQTASESLQLVAYDTAIIASITLLLNAHRYK